MANRNGKYNITGAVHSSLPDRRFLIAGVDNDVSLVAYNRGQSVEVVLFSNKENGIVISKWTVAKEPRNLNDLVRDLSRRKPLP